MFNFNFFLFFLESLKNRIIEIFSSDIKLYWLVLKYFFIILDLFLFIFIFYLLRKVNNFIPKFNIIKFKPKLIFIKKFKRKKIISPEILNEYWQEIVSKLLIADNNLTSKKLALKEIDNLLFTILERSGIKGSTLLEKIDKIDLNYYPELSEVINLKEKIINDKKNFNQDNFKKLVNLTETFLKKIDLLK